MRQSSGEGGWGGAVNQVEGTVELTSNVGHCSKPPSRYKSGQLVSDALIRLAKRTHVPSNAA